MANQYVIIREHSAGNESVGDMWKETKIFDGSVTLDDAMDWALDKQFNKEYSSTNITITKPHL